MGKTTHWVTAWHYVTWICCCVILRTQAYTCLNAYRIRICVTQHEAAQIASQKWLQEVHAATEKQRKYNSGATWRALAVLFTEWFGSAPYEWQLDVAEALLLVLDSVVIAGTGLGKTIPFMLPLLHLPDKMVLIILPLKVLQTDQVRA